MNQQTLAPGPVDRFVAGVLILILFVAGFFVSLLLLTIAGVLGSIVAARIWWARRRADRRFIDAKYRVIEE